MNTYVWIMLVLLCALAVPVVWTSVNRCQKCHGFCEDEEACKDKQAMNAFRENRNQDKTNHEQKENNTPAA